jgi:hypothetical protein
MLCSRPLTPPQANDSKHLVYAPKVYVPSEQRLCGKPGGRRLTLSCWVEVVGLEEFAGEGVGKKIEAPAAPMITSAPLISSSTRLIQKLNLEPNSQV